jgi:secondary thiamine-phosphate synthase enzyme
VTTRLSPITRVTPQVLLSATLTVETRGAVFIEITREVGAFLREAKADDGALTVFLRHTSASLTIQENADPDVQTDLAGALDRIAPQHAGYVHDTEGPDDMPAHIKAMLTGVSLSLPVTSGKAALGTWQGIYLLEHRRAPHTREVMLQFIGTCRDF